MRRAIYDNDTFFNNYLKLREKDFNYNDYVEKPYILDLMGNFKNKSILDVGCGYGVMSRFFAENGAKRIYGIDVSNNMINKAIAENKLVNIEYNVLDCAKLSSINDKFDIVYSSLCFHYIEDYDKLFSDIFNLLNSGGKLVFSMEHPIMTATMNNNAWIRDDEGNYKYYLMDNYCNEGERNIVWLKTKIKKYHHTIETIINTLIKSGFAIEKISEAKIGNELMEKNIDMQKDIHRPSYLMVACRKG